MFRRNWAFGWLLGSLSCAEVTPPHTAYSQSILEKFGLENCKPTNTPVSVGLKLIKAVNESQVVDASRYQSAVGSLLYLSGWTRPDIAFAVSNVVRFCSRPTSEHWTAVKRIFRYLKGTSQFGLLYVKGKNEMLSAYSDADWAGDINDRKSTSGYICMLSGGAVSWRSRKQTCVALSTAEAEWVIPCQITQWITPHPLRFWWNLVYKLIWIPRHQFSNFRQIGLTVQKL